MNSLELADIGPAGVGEPNCCGVGENGFQDGFEGEEDCFLILAPRCPREGLQDLEAAGRSCCYFGDMRGEGEKGIEGNTEYFWFLDCGDGDIIDGEGWFRVHLTGPGSEEGDRGFFGSDAHFVFPGPAGHRSEGAGEEGGDG